MSSARMASQAVTAGATECPDIAEELKSAVTIDDDVERYGRRDFLRVLGRVRCRLGQGVFQSVGWQSGHIQGRLVLFPGAAAGEAVSDMGCERRQLVSAFAQAVMNGQVL